EKQVLQIASVIGQTFPEPVLDRVVLDADPRSTLLASGIAPALAALSEAEFVYEEAVYPERQYAFKHPLTQQVAYESLLREHRKRTHVSVARVLEISRSCEARRARRADRLSLGGCSRAPRGGPLACARRGMDRAQRLCRGIRALAARPGASRPGDRITRGGRA